MNFQRKAHTHAVAVGALLLMAALSASAQFGELQPVTARSTTGQFVVRGIPQGPPRARSGSTSEVSYLRIDPSLTTVALERIRQAIYTELDLPEKWRGPITVNTFPTAEDDAPVTVTSVRYSDGWGYRVQMPEIVDKPRFLRCAVTVILMEIANRGAVTREVDLPPWLADGLTAHLEANSLPTLALEPETRIAREGTRADPLRTARELVRAHGPLTFTQLSLPSDAERSGANVYLYRACSFLYVNELLHLRGGRAGLRQMLTKLTAHHNWQTALLLAFHDDFPRLIDADKWYTLAVTHVAGRDASSVWPHATTFAQLDEILTTQVQVRASTNDLPITTQVKLQRFLSEGRPDRQAPVLRQKLAQLEILRRRAPREMVELIVEYELALNGCINRGAFSAKHAREVVRQLDELDQRLETLRAELKSDAATAQTR